MLSDPVSTIQVEWKKGPLKSGPAGKLIITWCIVVYEKGATIYVSIEYSHRPYRYSGFLMLL